MLAGPVAISLTGSTVQELEIANGADPSKPAPRISSDWFSGDLLETLPAAVYVRNAEAVVVAYNGRASELWGRAVGSRAGPWRARQ
jgi:hypothetical protein